MSSSQTESISLGVPHSPACCFRWYRRLILAAVVVGTIVTAIGCNNVDPAKAERTSVSGKVTLNGKPLDAGAILFHSNGHDPSAKTITAFSFIEDGSYQIDANVGPAVGFARVEFRSKPLQREALEEAVDQLATSRSRRPIKTSIIEIPSKYGSESELQVELTRGENQHNFELDSRP